MVYGKVQYSTRGDLCEELCKRADVLGESPSIVARTWAERYLSVMRDPSLIAAWQQIDNSERVPQSGTSGNGSA